MPLTSYAEARPWAKAIREEVLTRRMPKWHAARGYGDFENDPSLSPFEIALIVAWADGGAPKGADGGKEQGRTKKEEGEEEARYGTKNAREVTVPCADRLLPSGRLLAVRPELEKGASVGIAIGQPDGSREIVGWIRNFAPEFETTYRLRNPILLRPGSRLITVSDGQCTITLTVASRR